MCRVAGRMLPVRWAWSSILGRWWGNEGGNVGGDCMGFLFFCFLGGEKKTV